MAVVYLSRRNLLSLLSKLDRAKAGHATKCTLTKEDTSHPKYPCTFVTDVIAVEDDEYYGSGDREAGAVHPLDDPTVPTAKKDIQ